MYIVVAVLIGIALGFIRRGSIRAILEHPYKNWVFAAVGLMLLLLIHVYCLLPAIPDFSQYLPIASFFAYILIFITLIYNLDDVYTILMAIGITLNFVVTFINGGLMPVSTAVIDIMPLHAALTQSIYAGTGGVYSILVPTQTLLSFLSTTIPVPFFANITAMTGYVSGLSFGSILTYIGLIGCTQKAMTLPYETLQETETVFRSKEKYPIEEEPESPQFETKTDELFYEEDRLPHNPLDKMFDEVEAEPQPTQLLREITVSEEHVTPNTAENKSLEELASLTRPISETLKIELPEEVEAESKAIPEISEEEGFFVSRFNAEREKRNQEEPAEKDNQEKPTIENEPETGSEEQPYARDDLLNALDSSPILEETLTEELEEEPIFQRDEDLSEVILLEEETVETEVEEEVETEVAAETIEFEELEDYESVEPEETEIETVEESEETEEESKETELQETEPQESETSKEDETEESAKVDLKVNEAIILGGPVLEEAETVATEEDITTQEEKLLERLEKGELSRDLLYEILTQSGVENVDEILGSEIDMDSIIVENSDESDQKMDLDRVMEELGQKRGSIQEDERTGYMLTKAYLEMSSRDKSEEQMLDVWSQVAEENRERKLGRRRRASANYQTNNPYSEERERSRQKEIDRIRAEQEEKRWQERAQKAENSRHQEETAKAVNAQSSDVDTTLMSEEERIAAGYEKVNFEFSGKTISFWRKKNE